MSALPIDHPAALSLDSLLKGGLEAVKNNIVRALKREDYSEALKIANEGYSTAGPKDLNAALTYAILLNHRGLGEEAMGILKKAMAHHADAPEIQLAQVESLLVREQADDALALMEALESVPFRDARHVAYLGDLFLDVGMDDNALQAYERAIDAGSTDPGVALNIAQLRLERAESELAGEAFELAGRLSPSDPEIWASAGDTWLGVEHYSRAIRAYRRATLLDADDARSWMSMGVALAEEGELEDALDAFKQAQKLEPDDALHWLNIGHMQLEIGKPEAARQSYLKAAGLDPDNSEAAAGLTAAAFELGDVELAEEMGARAVALDPGNPDAHFNLGIIELSLGRTERARREFEAALEIVPDEARYLLSMAAVKLRDGEIEEALEIVRQATTDGNDDATGLFEFGRDLFRFGGAERVEKFVRTTESIDPRWSVIRPLFEFLARSLRRDEDAEGTKRTVRAFVDNLKENPDLVPIIWDFGELERLVLALESDDRDVLDTMLAVLEGRKDLDALDTLAA